MKVNIVVHDFFNEIGHSKAMKEVLKNLPQELNHIHIICYTHAPKEELFPDFRGDVSFSKVPLPRLKPFIIKSLFFQFYTLFFKKSLVIPHTPIITIGVCSFIGDIVNVQFVHRLWSQLYFKVNKVSFIKYIYKKILLAYLDFSEYLYYNFKQPHLVCLSQFIADDFKKRYNYPDHKQTVAYSSASLEEFGPTDESRLERYETLKRSYPQLRTLDLNRPIYLFVGAYERKGLPAILESIDDNQLIIIGKAESGSHLDLTKENLIQIPFTKELANFYNLCDCFIFPTLYEPFGLVVLEAAASGASVIVTKEMVGASELLRDADDIHFCHKLNLGNLIKERKVLSSEQRQINYQQRMNIFKQYSWQEAAQVWYQVLKKIN